MKATNFPKLMDPVKDKAPPMESLDYEAAKQTQKDVDAAIASGGDRARVTSESMVPKKGRA